MIGSILGLIMRAVFLLTALIFFAGLLLVAVLVLVLWLVRALWARLTGQPVSPWTFQFNRQALWQRVYPASGQGSATSRADAEVIDVEIKEVKELREIKAPEH